MTNDYKMAILEPLGNSQGRVMLMRNRKSWTLVGAVLTLSLLLAACAPAVPLPASATASPPPTPTPTSTPPTPTATGEFEQTFNCRFGFMPAMWDFEGARQAGGAYDRPFFELFEWGMIEKEPGVFDFSETDEYILSAQAEGFHILANIQPFADWDHTGKGKPSDMELYKNFVTKLVERYDGDSVNDMPGLTIPIKHWEVLNEPEFQEEPVVFFQGSSADYFEILKATYETVREADPEALVVQGGMAGMMEVCTEFWQGVFDLGGADYFDVANMHSIGHGEHLNIPSFKQFLANNGIQKSIWVTEVQYQQAEQTQDCSAEDFAKILARSYIFALANDVEKLFYVNIKLPPVKEGVPFDERSALIKDNGDKSPLFYAHLTVANMLGDLNEGDEVEIIKEKIGSWSIEEGQYRFNIEGKTVYALWGVGSLPAEITGEVKVTEISGTQTVADSATLQLSDSPIFVEAESTPEPTDILAYYRAYSGDPNVVDTEDLLKAADDWANGITPPDFSEPLTTEQLLQLADEWAAG